MSEWYQKNKKKQNEKVLGYYHKNKDRWDIRRSTNTHREEILKKQRDNRLLKKTNKFPVIETVVKDEAIPVQLL
jgi:hypothetical protein